MSEVLKTYAEVPFEMNHTQKVQFLFRFQECAKYEAISDQHIPYKLNHPFHTQHPFKHDPPQAKTVLKIFVVPYQKKDWRAGYDTDYNK